MIHMHEEGQSYRIGLNITLGRGALCFTWCWLDTATGMMSIRRLRFRRHHTPHILAHKHVWSYVDSFLWGRNKLAVPLTWAEDYIPERLFVRLFHEELLESNEDAAKCP